MKRFLTGFGLGIVGIALALGLTLGALAVAGPHIGDPPMPPTIDTSLGEAAPTVTESPADTQGGHGSDDGKGNDLVSPSPSDSPSASVSSGNDSGSSDGTGSSTSGSSGSDDRSGTDSGDHEPHDD